MENIRIPIGAWVDSAFDWLKENVAWFFDAVTWLFNFLIEVLTDVLVDLHPLVIILLLALIGWVLRSWQMAVGTVITMFFIMTMDQWVASM